jgi:hypothetical protein
MRSIISFSESFTIYGGYSTKPVALIIGMVLVLLCLSDLVGQEPMHFNDFDVYPEYPIDVIVDPSMEPLHLGSFEVISGYGGNRIVDRSREQENREWQRFEPDRQALSEDMAPLMAQRH